MHFSQIKAFKLKFRMFFKSIRKKGKAVTTQSFAHFFALFAEPMAA